MAEKSNLEKYLAGEPLNEELARIRAGKDEEPPAMDRLQQIHVAPEPARDKPLTAADRQEIRDLRNSPGWAIFLMLQKKAIATHIESASRLSRGGSLEADDLANEWRSVRMFERACFEVVALVEAQIAELEREEKK
jgi:hypothetical protein